MRLTGDYPKLWLAAFVLAGWVTGRIWPHGPGVLRVWGLAAAAVGLALMIWAGWTMRGARTTVDPHGQPRALVTAGPFSLSRNPIYLADAMILAGLCLAFHAPLAALPLTAGFVAVISARFIVQEEQRLLDVFPDAFAAYRRHTRRWL
ncbi:isoprenylcysteine carboxylmethyltransferase family protein [uncultured Paracoccus sp.]|uniref:methyltransferase family protein n=1 Tax=uncultured Paracoccus sp. TaxID=189685 RepID=UPI0025D365C5|nr:isoprenylcysteine carboxylmethyltransferase family protein [uncultured Paracoccus sp.]